MKIVNFYSITNVMGMPNRGPIIQTKNKEYYFKRDIKDIEIKFNPDPTPQWKHTLNPHYKPLSGKNVSIGPNIDLNKGIPRNNKDCYVVADSLWMKNYLMDKFNIMENKISIIPIYVNDIFHTTTSEPSEEFTIGCVGYYQNNDIKNLMSLAKICNKLPNVRFELLSSRNKSKFPLQLQNIPNLHFFNLPHNEVIDRMKKWNGYLGMSKRERGPAVLQELKVLGIPTICPLHTGYEEFHPLIGLDIKPFKSHNDNDINKFVYAINSLQNNYEYYSNIALEESERFWNEKKSTKHISKLWEDFFKKMLGEK